MLINKSGNVVRKLDFRGTNVEDFNKIPGAQLINILASALQQISTVTTFKATDLAPKDWKGTAYEPILTACDGDRKKALKLFGVIIKQSLIMTQILFTQEDSGDDFTAAIYTKESLQFEEGKKKK